MTSANKDGLKSAIDLAMERLANKENGGLVNLTPDQKEAIADIAKRTKAKIAETEIMFRKRIAELQPADDEKAASKITEMEHQLQAEITKLREREEYDKRKIRG